jgi:hypothetical protein
MAELMAVSTDCAIKATWTTATETPARTHERLFSWHEPFSAMNKESIMERVLDITRALQSFGIWVSVDVQPGSIVDGEFRPDEQETQ